MTNREIMRSQLMKTVIAPLREKGFSGAYPHFRRFCEGYVELITFQTNKWGGSFTVELSAVFPGGKNKNYTVREGLSDKTLTVWDTNNRYRVKGMFNGWFYYRDVYAKNNLFFGKTFFDVPEKQTADFSAPKGYKLVQAFDDYTAVEICNEVNRQLVQGFKWLVKFEKENGFPQPGTSL